MRAMTQVQETITEIAPVAPERGANPGRVPAKQSFSRKLFRPELLFRPGRLLQVLAFKPSGAVQQLPLPWNCTISARSAEVIGKLIATLGLYDLPLTEAIMRLADPGDAALDVGANIGYTALVLALSAGPTGHVRVFEPNPHVIPTLSNNVKQWASLPLAPIEIDTVALSDRDGEAILGFPGDYAKNEGLASLELKTDGVPVRVLRLDSLDIDGAGIVKIDVEGHEAAVISGATRLLKDHRIRDILFEEHEEYPARSHQILLDHEYSIFRVSGSMFGPLLLPPATQARAPFLPPVYPPNYLATVDPSRAQARFRARGWKALSSRPRE